MRRNNVFFIGNAEALQHIDGMLHRLPVGGRTHDHGNERSHKTEMLPELMDNETSAQAFRRHMTTAKIIYTYTDEAPALATHSLLPIIQAFT